MSDEVGGVVVWLGMYRKQIISPVLLWPFCKDLIEPLVTLEHLQLSLQLSSPSEFMCLQTDFFAFLQETHWPVL